MKKLFLSFLFCIAVFLQTNAQGYVSIPDSNFVSWLQSNVPSAMSGSQLDTTAAVLSTITAMNISDDSISDITGIEYFPNLLQLNCSQNQISHMPPFAASLTSIDCSSNHLDSIPALPSGVTTLICNGNYINELPALPAGLLRLDCYVNNLSILPELPSGITHLDIHSNSFSAIDSIPFFVTYFDCSYNTITAMPPIPSSLDTLICGFNNLSALPGLPITLMILHCYSNNLTALPLLPNSLLDLDCNNNLITALPVLPPNLTKLNCSNNPLHVLPALPGMLNTLYCAADLLTALPSLPASINDLECSNNALDSLGVLPANLNVLHCNNDSLFVLPVLPASLGRLECDQNFLNVLPTLPSGLYTLWCRNNNIVSVLNLPGSMSEVRCDNNSITGFSGFPAGLTYLSCTNNLINGLPAFPGSMRELYCNNNAITCFNKFPLSLDTVYLTPNPFTCLPNYLAGMDAGLLGYPLCIDGDTINNPHGCPAADGIVGFAYEDTNLNCSKDSADYGLKNVRINLLNAGGTLLAQTYTALNGVYQLGDSSGTYTVQMDTVGMPFVQQCTYPGTDSTLTLTTAYPLATDVNFDVQCKPGFDLGVRSITHDRWVFPNEITTVTVNAGDMSQWYHLHCASGMSGTVSIHVTGPVTYVGAAPGALIPVVSGTVFTYAIADFGLIQNDKDFRLMFRTDSLAHAGEYFCIQASVSPVSGDNDSTNNLVGNCFAVINSHDPNLKEVYPTRANPGYSDWLTYTVHFQNTGSAPALNIRVLDTLDSNLDLSTFEVLGYDHYNLTTLAGNVLTIRFPNILLPDSTTDAAASMAYFQFRIKVKPGMALGTSVTNTAVIYFDFNDPISTNTALTEFVRATGIDDPFKSSDFIVYPNPTNGLIHIKGPFAGSTLELFDVVGRKILEKTTADNEMNFDFESYPAGLYFYRVTMKNGRVEQGKVIRK